MGTLSASLVNAWQLQLGAYCIGKELEGTGRTLYIEVILIFTWSVPLQVTVTVTFSGIADTGH